MKNFEIKKQSLPKAKTFDVKQKMKVFLFILTLVYKLKASQLCDNPFLKSLKDENVTILRLPLIKTYSYCKSEWQAFGSCCSENSLLTMYYQEKEKNDIMLNATADILDDIAEIIKNVAEKTEEIKIKKKDEELLEIREEINNNINEFQKKIY